MTAADTMGLPLFTSAARARRTDPHTSHEAAASVDVQERERQVLEALANHPEGLTTREMAEVTGIDRVSLSPRTKPLERKGLVARSGTRDKSTVWVLA